MAQQWSVKIPIIETLASLNRALEHAKHIAANDL